MRTVQPNNVSVDTLPKVNLAVGSLCLLAMLAIQGKCLWRVWGSWQASQIWYILLLGVHEPALPSCARASVHRLAGPFSM